MSAKNVLMAAMFILHGLNGARGALLVGMVWCALVCYAMVWYGAVCYGVVYYGMLYCGILCML